MITIKRLGNYERSNDDRIKNQYLYSGSDNPMTMSHIYSTHWLCEYKMMSYPFDTQVISSFYNFVTKIKGKNNFILMIVCLNNCWKSLTLLEKILVILNFLQLIAITISINIHVCCRLLYINILTIETNALLGKR